MNTSSLNPKTLLLPEYDKETSQHAVGWVKHNTAIMVVHGIGHQQPLETLDQFARGLVESYQQLFPGCISTAHKVQTIERDGEVAFQNVLQISHSDYPGRTIDLYEYYWAYCTQDKAGLTDINLWLQGVAKGAKKHYRHLNEDLGIRFQDESLFFKNGKFVAWKYDLFLNFVVKAAILLNFIIELVLKVIGLVPFVGNIAQSLLKKHFENRIHKLSNLVGDIVIYNVTDEKSRFFPVRKKILDGATQTLQELLERTEDNELCYPSVVVAGHSLGSEIAYDAINRLNLLANTGKLKYYDQDGLAKQGFLEKGVPACLSEQLNGFITFGSPLDKIAFFLRQVVPENFYLWQQIVDHYHCFKQGAWTQTAAAHKLTGSSIKRLLDDIRWNNYYDSDDMVSGRLDYYVNLTNVECRFNCLSQFSPKPSKFTHSHYWQCAYFYEDIIRNFLSPKNRESENIQAA
ncbi:hypothetical protein V9K67_09460 [Paraflavisolibacter sp. H34]|uniref:hypothetical protein n=1 Tax=Huijunlia imazamoxiresistens TaxID=3127457 RepID=UPI0030166C60